jgi:3-oxoacid CoA-transferase B subunit
MDLVSGVKAVYVMTSHCTRDGIPKLVKTCSYPLTGVGVVNRIYTDLAVVEVGPDGFEVVDLTEGVTFDEVAALTASPIQDARSARVER